MTLGKLFWLQPDNTIIEFPLKMAQNVIGRGSRCEVRIKHPAVSTSHALIRITNDATTVEDLGSTNGTRVNGKRVQTHVLRHGDQIGVGRERLMYFAELDDAATFVQPPAIEPYVLPAPGGERVNTGAPADAKRLAPTVHLSKALDAALAVPPVEKRETVPLAPPLPAYAAAAIAAHTKATAQTPAVSGGMPELDPRLLAALPMGSTLTQPAAPKPSAPAHPRAAPAEPVTTSAPSAARVVTPAGSLPLGQQASPKAAAVPAAASVRPVTASISVLSGPATGKIYPLDQQSVTLGKEGKQVVEIVRAGQARWQIRQREGPMPAYVNGDALVGTRDLAAGFVIELVGVRLRFDLALT